MLSTLGALSGFLSIAAIEGPGPPEEKVADLAGQVHELVIAITDDTELPPEMEREVLDHLQRLYSSLIHFRVGEPGAVQTALDQLRVTVAFVSEPVEQTGAWKRVVAVGGAAWMVFTSGPAVAQAIDGWGQVIQALPPGGH